MSPRAPVLAVALICFGASGACVHHMSANRTTPGTASAPETPWSPPSAAPPAPTPAATPAPTGLPQDLQKIAQGLGLNDLIDLALRNNPDTRAAWSAARAAAADLGSQRGAYYPTIFAQELTSKVKGSAVGGQFTFHSTTTNPSIVLNYLLLDFGARKAAVEEARQALVAADWTHNAAIQNAVLNVQQSYYQYLNARALEVAAQAVIKEAQASLDAADKRHVAGLSTIADVLQAKTVLSQAQLGLETIQGQIQVIRGVLATSIGVPANTPFDVEIPEQEVPLSQGIEDVDRLIEQAQARRPDLAAARALVLKADAHADHARAQFRPSLSTSLTDGRIYYSPAYNYQDTYGLAFLLTVPIFNGLSYQYSVFKAEADAETSRAQLESLRQQTIFQVWSSYYNQKTATQRVLTTRDLLSSAQQSYEAVSARYKAGVGNILDVLTGVRALADARAQETQARTDWFLSMAQLAHDTGTLWAPEAHPRGDEP
jgi:outer membrane protein